MKRKHLLIILLINVLIRIPRILSPQGQDGFYLVWEAKLFLQGSYFQNGANLEYLLGLYPFSGYPFGSILIMSFLLLITNSNIFASILVYDFLFVIIFVIGIVYLSKELKLDFPQSEIFVLFTTLIPNILIFSYFTSSTRLAYLALLPFVLANLLKWNKTKKIKYNLISVFLILIQLFLHRMAMLLIVIYFISCVIYVYQFHLREWIKNLSTKSRTTENQRSKNENFARVVKYTKSRYWIFLIIIAYSISFISISGNWIGEFNLNKIFNYPNFFPFSLFQSMLDLFFNYGVVILVFIFAMAFLLFPKYNNILSQINENKAFHYLFLYLLPLFTIQSVYSIYHIILIISIVSAYFVVSIINNRFKLSAYLSIGISLIILVFIWLYKLLVTNILPHEIIASVISFILIGITSSIVFFSGSNTKRILSKIKRINIKNLLITIFLIQTIYFSVFLVDRHTIYSKNQAGTDTFISKDEMVISEFLIGNGTGFFATHDSLLSIRIAALSGWFPLQDWHNLGIFLNNLTGIQTYSNSCQIESIFKWYNREIFNCDTLNGRILFSGLIINDVNSTISMSIIQNFQIKFFISNKNSNYSLVYSKYIESDFIISLYGSVPLVLETEKLLVWDLSVLH